MSTVASIHNDIATLWNRRDFDALRKLYHPNYTYTGGDGKEMAGGPDVGVQVAQMYATAFPDATLEVKSVYTQGSTAVGEMVGRGTHNGSLMGIAPTGKPVEVPICNVIEMRNGKIYREREYLDMASILTQIGVLHAAAAAGAS